MAANLLQLIKFGQAGDDQNHLGDGWSAAEVGFRWMIGAESHLWLDNPGQADAFVLCLELSPFCVAPTLPSQRLSILLRGQPVGDIVLEKGGSVAFPVPAAIAGGKGPVHIVFRHPDAARPTEHGHPNDARQLAVALRSLAMLPVHGDTTPQQIEGGTPLDMADIGSVTGVPAAQFVMQFESLGDNCEFGLVQRRCGAEPLGLLRFSNIWLPDLVHAIDTEFAGLGEPDQLSMWTDDSERHEYILRDKRFGLTFHTFLYRGEVDESRFLQQQAARMKLLRRKLLEDVVNGEKIFVIKRNEPPREAEMLALYAALRRHGDATLLWVLPADADHGAGSVERVLPGFLKGYIDRFAPYENAHDMSFGMWLRLCANARRIAATDRVAA